MESNYMSYTKVFCFQAKDLITQLRFYAPFL